MVTVAPFDDIQPDDDIRIDWIEVDPQERDPARAFRLFRSHTRACGTVSQPIQSRDSLREDKCPSALLRAHSDPWADVRRPWMVIKFGNTTVAIRDSDAIWAAVQQIHDALSVHHVMLEEAPLFYSLQSLNAKEVTIEAQTRIRAAKKRLFPVLLLTDDDKEPGVFSAYVRERLSRDVYVFEVSGQELADIASSSSERPYKHLDDVDLPERASNFADGGRMHDEYAEGHRGISNANERELSADDEDASSSFDCRSELVYSPCGSSKEKGVIVTADDVNEALRYAKNNPSDSSLVLDIAHPHIFNRLAAPFRGPIPNIRLMQLLYISCSRKSHLKEVNDCACRLIGIVISTRFIPTLCVRFGVPAVNNPHAWDDDFTDFLVVIMQLFSIIDGFNYHGEDVFHAWTTYYDLLVELPDEFWRDEVSKDWLEDMAVELKTPLSEDMQRTCLIFGQIVCLSSDGFREELHLARIVTNEMVNETICFSPFTEDEVFAKSGKYLLAEPNAFLEFYEHVLAILQVDKLSEQFKPSNLDGSQQRAIVRALTEELAIIQGPPGTGKTFIGVEAASILLQNRQRWGIIEPILVVAHSNNAVDQFSERLIEKINADIEKGFLRHDGPLAVRLGGQSGSEFLKRWRFTKLDVVKQFRFLCSEETNEKLQSQQRKKMSALERLQEASFVLHCFKRHLISLNCLKKNNVIPGSLLAEMRTWKGCHCDSQGNPLDDEEVLACWLLGRAYNQKNCREMPLEEEEDSREKNAEREQLFSADDADGLETLDDLLENANKYADDDEELNDELYLTEKVWDIVDTGYVAKEVILLEGRVKGYFEKSFGQGKPPLDRTFKQECSEALHAIFRAVPMSSEEAADVKSMFSLPKGRRWELYMFWMKQLRDRIRKSLPSSMESYRLACKRTRDASCKVNAEVLRRCLFVSATTTGAAKERELLRRLRCPIVFVEEAALVLEAHTLSTLLPSVEHVVLIGDHQQLKPSAEVYELAREYHLDVSMFERLVRNGHPYSTLQVQHRMNTDITENIIRPFFYPSVADSESVRNYPEVPGMHKKCFFWMHEEPETTPFNETSRSCSYEVTMVVALVSYLKKQGIALNEITVLATYWAQATDIQKAMAANFGLLPDGGAAIDVQTVDRFQGKENRIVIVSLVRSFMDGIGFLGVQNRVTVALTRARHGMYVVGNLVYLARCSSFWRDIAHHIYNKGFAGDRLPIRCQRHGNVQTIEHPSDFAEKSPDGGCMEICNGELPCGHTCPRRCHPIDDHDSYKCLKQCRRRCKNEQYRHSCQRPCCEECGDCYQVVTVSLNCGHSTNATCSAVASARCDQRCEKLLQCGHRCPARCGQPCDAPCLEPVTVTNDVCNHSWTVACSEVSSAGECPMNCPEILPCGHQCAELCGKPCTFSCMKLVKRELKCGHKVSLPCSEDETKKLCEVGVLQEIAECGHSAILPCHAGSDRRFCPKQCGKVLPCGHTCSRECGECHREGECRCQDVCDKLLRCGHKCAKRCWESCEPCMQLCLNSCKHRDCGNSGGDQPFKYGRNCSQLCVLCPQLCDNICRHRSCSNRCYEECSVGRCEQPCTKKLACGHACLGMCGEECPRLCGTCNKPAYLRLLEKHMESSHALSKLPRIIELDRCGHIFPVEFLDKHMETLEAQSEPLRCPLSTCQALIVRVQRYVKIVRKRYLDRYSKLMSQSEPTPPNAAVLLLMNCTRMKQENAEANKLCDWLSRYCTTRMKYAVIPRARYLSVRALFYSDLMTFEYICNAEKKNPSNSAQLQALRKSVERVEAATMDQDYMEVFGEFENLIMGIANEVTIKSKFNCQMRIDARLNLPDF
ncbi:hypothetical protein Q1695_014641 [Nippostrongylus brasiliensis]|nr:hypothetical protein Q1695_014641 [Nippostrongylus brasiliensis]